MTHGHEPNRGAARDATRLPLTDEQRRIVEAPDGPFVVIAGAGTGKTNVIVERVRWLLETHGERVSTTGAWVAAEPAPRHGAPFTGPLVPEQVLVLTYNVKAAAELGERLDKVVGPAVRARMTVSNFHSFCHHVLTESAADADLPTAPDVLDGPAQLLLLWDLRPVLDLRYYGDYAYGALVSFINRAKDELVTPDDFDAFVAAEREEYERRYGSYAATEARLLAAGSLDPLRKVQKAYGATRRAERAEDLGLPARSSRPDDPVKAAEREARRTFAGDGSARALQDFPDDVRPRILDLAQAYERDGAALEVLRLTEMGRVYRAYQAELVTRGALDFGEQIALVAHLFKTRPNVLRRWQRQYRYLLIDEFQDANIAQIELIELLGRTPGPAGQRHGRGRRRPVDLPVPRRQLRGLRGVRGPLLAPARPRARRPGARTAAAAAHRPQLPLGGARAHGGQPADRLQQHPVRAGQAPHHHPPSRGARGAVRVRQRGGPGRRDRGRDPRAGRAGTPRHSTGR